MSLAKLLLVVLGGSIAALVVPVALWIDRPAATNYRGARVAEVLGIPVVAGTLASVILGAALSDDVRQAVRSFGTGRWLTIVLAVLAVFAAGLYDDIRSGPGRGLVGHVRELQRGRMSSGWVKVFVVSLAAATVAVAARSSLPRALIGIPVMAGCANLWNLLDVRPGRCVKAFLVVAAALAWSAAPVTAQLVPAGMGAAAAVTWPDLRERAMLGDAGANLLGFVAGIGLFGTLSTPWLVVALGAILALHAVAETATLSRVIRAVGPVRWLDDLGRVKTNPPP